MNGFPVGGQADELAHELFPYQCLCISVPAFLYSDSSDIYINPVPRSSCTVVILDVPTSTTVYEFAHFPAG